VSSRRADDDRGSGLAPDSYRATLSKRSLGICFASRSWSAAHYRIQRQVIVTWDGCYACRCSCCRCVDSLAPEHRGMRSPGDSHSECDSCPCFILSPGVGPMPGPCSIDTCSLLCDERNRHDECPLGRTLPTGNAQSKAYDSTHARPGAAVRNGSTSGHARPPLQARQSPIDPESPRLIPRYPGHDLASLP
jgi:hypothetical protein